MKLVFDKDNSELLHILYRKEDFNSRKDIVSSKEFIQVASLVLKKNQTFKPHMHIWKNIKEKIKIAQESWVVIEGSVEVTYYDKLGNLISVEILNQGDCTITLQGGHNYKALKDRTLVYEFKTGPYEGQELDKKFIS